MVEGTQHVRQVVVVGLGIVDVAGVVGVGGADVAVLERSIGQLAPRHEEQAALVIRNRDDDGDVVADQAPGHRDVHTLGGPDRIGMDTLVESTHVIGPDARGRHHDVGPHRHLARAGVDDGAVDPAVQIRG